ncbi:MAG: NADH-quinone oxidoreductase subunit NuoF [Bacillota bacterium]
MESLMDKCCSQCKHTPATPCKDYVVCRSEGPLCHDDDSCTSKRKKHLARILTAPGSGLKKIVVCGGLNCGSGGAFSLIDLFIEEVARQGLREKVEVVLSGCRGFCEQGPSVIVEPDRTFYRWVTAEDVPEIVAEHLKENRVVERLLYQDPETGASCPTCGEIPFYKRQMKVVLEHCGFINPEDISEYIAVGGYRALTKAVNELTPDNVLAEVKKSGLRGRGGAGFPTGRKWETARRVPSNKRYVICNADEGDPGAFMDRAVLEGNPHSVIEGMLLCAYVIGSDEGYIYVRAEYPLAVRRLRIAIEQAERFGLLGDNILNSGLSFRIHINEGAGAFVCGESTALMNSIEGNRGIPRIKVPRSTEKGLFGKPTVLNNVETFANVPKIIVNGGAWFASIGTERSKGTKIFALTGKVRNTGLVEVPMGITLRELIFQIGGGIKGGKRFKALQIGGPSGGSLPEDMLDLQIDYESLTGAGAMMGSGSIVVMDEDNCMVNMAKFFLNFTERESCGKCTPCREGTTRMLEVLERITTGQGSVSDIPLLEYLGGVVKSTSFCGLGTSAPNPVLTTLSYFRNEYLKHINDKRCPAGECLALRQFMVITEKCTGCGACRYVCPAHAITGEKKKPHRIDMDICIRCGRCYEICKYQAIKRR